MGKGKRKGGWANSLVVSNTFKKTELKGFEWLVLPM